MEDSKTYRTGIIENDGGNLVFFEQGFDFHFMLSDYRPFSSDNSHTLEATDSGFVYGTTHDNYSIAIFIGDTNKPVYGKHTVQTYMYLLTPGNMMPYPRKREILYDGIVFTGKTLKRVFYPHALVSHPTEEGQIVLYQDDTMVYHFEVDGVQYTLRVNSDATQGTRNHGIYMINENIRLQLTFSKQQTAADIKKHYSFRRYIARYCFLLYQGFIFSTISFNWTFLNFLFTFRHSMQLLVSLMLYHTIILTIFKLIYLLLESDFSKSTEN